MRKEVIIGIVIITVVVLAAAWYLVSPLFINKIVDEESPIQNNENGNSIEEQGEPDNLIAYSGSFVDADDFHKVSGTMRIVSDQDMRYLRLEDFKSTNGPDLKVYLSDDLQASNYISLGDLKGNIGNQNYEIPENINLEDYKYTLIWCEQFSVLFGSAELNSD